VNCTLGRSTTSVHFYWPASKHHGPTCVGEAGTTSLGGNPFSSICTGNNRGWFSSSGSRHNFTPGSWPIIFHARITKVHISGWSGGSKCPAP
jgi:hypothetical protein